MSDILNRRVDDVVRDGHLVQKRFDYYGADTEGMNYVQHSGTAAPSVLVFDGTDDYAEVAYNALFDFERTDPFTIWARFRIHSATGEGAPIIERYEDAPVLGRGWRLVYGPSGALRAVIAADDVNDRIQLHSSTVVADGNWHSGGFTYTGSSIASGVSIFSDGVSETTTTTIDGLTSSTKTSAVVRVAIRTGGGQRLTVDVAEVCIYARALTAQEMADLHAGRPINTGGRVAHWIFAEGSGTSVTDISGNNLTATISGATWNTEEFPSPNVIRLASTASASDDAYNNYGIRIDTGTGSGQDHPRVLDYIASKRLCILTSPWTTNPDATSTYSIIDRGY